MKNIERFTNSKFVKIIRKHSKGVIAAVAVILTAILTSQAEYLSTKLHDKYSKLEYKEGVITPLFYYDVLEYIDAKDYANKYGSEILDYGCILNTYVYNNKENPVAVMETSICIDNVDKLIQSKVLVIALYSDNEKLLNLYAINNGLAEFYKGKICISAQMLNEDKSMQEKISKDKQELLLGTDDEIEIANLASGEIRKIVSYSINEEMAKEIAPLWIFYNVVDESNYLNTQGEKECLILFDRVNSELSVSYGEGDSSDEVIERTLIIDVANDKGKELNVPAYFMVEGNSWENILYMLYPTMSCDLMFHAKYKCAGEEKSIETEKFRQKIYIPLYTDDDFYMSLRNFINKYNIETYYYNSNPTAQKEIEYVPVPNRQEVGIIKESKAP